MKKQFAAILFLVSIACSALNTPAHGSEEKPLAGDNIRVELDVPIAMRDEVQLFADVYRPSGPGPFPVILTRMPYDKQSSYGMMPALGRFWAQQGYVYVAQDVRGRFKSEGVFGRVDEISDGYDTIEWISKQPWCNGNIGATGESYYGYTTWAAAVGQHPNLKSIAPVDITPNLFERRFVNGVFRLQAQGGWALNMADGDNEGVEEIGWHHLPLISLGAEAGLSDSIYTSWVHNPVLNEFWNERSFHHRYDDIRIPALYIGGWYDQYTKGTIDGWQGVREQSLSLEARQKQWMVIGPWGHETVSTQFADHPEPLTKIGRLDIGNSAATTYSETLLAFFDYTLKGLDNGFDKTPPVRIFVIGDNEWRYEDKWPLDRMQSTPYYFHSDDSGQSAAAGGSLNITAPENQPGQHQKVSYDYDPADPVVYNMDKDIWSRASYMADRSLIAKRADVLTYNTPPLAEAIELTGPINVTLYAASTAPDTDFTAALVDVFPDGHAQLIQEGILRASFRESDTMPTLIEPGKIYQYEIDLIATSYVVQPGHKIRVEISSSNFPRFARNLNTGNSFGMSDKYAVATQTIYHSPDYPSHITLPVIVSITEKRNFSNE